MSFGLNRLVATAGGIGYLPYAPGTWASILAIVIWFLISLIAGDHYGWQIALIIVVFIAGSFHSGKVVADLSDKDPSHIVIDEIAGMWIALFFIPLTPQNMIAAFILFRFFDISKPFGIKRLENYKNGWGIMLDDVLSGIYSNLLLRAILFAKLW